VVCFVLVFGVVFDYVENVFVFVCEVEYWAGEDFCGFDEFGEVGDGYCGCGVCVLGGFDD